MEIEVGEVNNVFLDNEDDPRVRHGAIGTAEAIIDGRVDDFMDRFRARIATASIRTLRDQAERMRRHEVERAIRRLQLGESPERALERLSQSLTNKLLHPPTQALHNALEADRTQLVKLVERVYLLDGRE
jgi:glutamyl-tRNA reductase